MFSTILTPVIAIFACILLDCCQYTRFSEQPVDSIPQRYMDHVEPEIRSWRTTLINIHLGVLVPIFQSYRHKPMPPSFIPSHRLLMKDDP